MLENTASTNISIYLAFLVLVLPLLSFLVQVAIPKKMSYFTSYLASFILLGITLLSIRITMLNWIGHHSANIYWFQLGDYQMSIGMMLNRWAGVMLVIVSFVSLLVNLFSMKYMKNDVGYKRYYAILSLFSFSMIGIVLSDSLLVVFMFWELVGFCSYLLIGLWFDKTKAAYASQKAFIVNRIGDIGFVIALALCWANFKTFSLTEIQLILPQTLQGGSGVLLSTNILSMIGITFFIAAIGKSAQFPLQVWLPDAMEGPTPVSALIHAATMVAAGVYLLARLFFLLDVQGQGDFQELGDSPKSVHSIFGPNFLYRG